MKKLNLLLFDANIVIYLFKLGIWDKVIALCDVHLSETVVDEARFYDDASGFEKTIDLGAEIESGGIKTFGLETSKLAAFRHQFDPLYFERLDPGELESLVFLSDAEEEYLLCSADSIVFKVLGNLRLSHQGISLEEVLQRIGIGRNIEYQYSKKFREKWDKIGAQERMYGQGIGK